MLGDRFVCACARLKMHNAPLRELAARYCCRLARFRLRSSHCDLATVIWSELSCDLVGTRPRSCWNSVAIRSKPDCDLVGTRPQSDRNLAVIRLAPGHDLVGTRPRSDQN